MSASMPLISQLESTFQTGRRSLESRALVSPLLFALTLRSSGKTAPQKAAALRRDNAAVARLMFIVATGAADLAVRAASK
jgi:hypothetical protein